MRRVGEPETTACRYYFYDGAGRAQSPWHHIPLFAQPAAATGNSVGSGAILNFVNEIPRGYVGA